MSSVLHPVGPEESRTYWVRRALVLGAVLAVVLLIVIIGVNASGDDRQAVPQKSPSAASTDPSREKSAGASPSPSATPTPTPTPSPTPKKSKTPSPSPTKTTPPDCDPDDLRTTLTGKQKFKAKEDLTFNLSLINGGPRSCVVEMSADNFELKVTSGSDEIWSTADCSKSVKAIKKTVGPEKSVEWKMTWDGKRSVDGCKTRPEVPQPGTYLATAHLKGAKQVKLGMTLVD